SGGAQHVLAPAQRGTALCGTGAAHRGAREAPAAAPPQRSPQSGAVSGRVWPCLAVSRRVCPYRACHATTERSPTAHSTAHRSPVWSHALPIRLGLRGAELLDVCRVPREVALRVGPDDLQRLIARQVAVCHMSEAPTQPTG